MAGCPSLAAKAFAPAGASRAAHSRPPCLQNIFSLAPLPLARAAYQIELADRAGTIRQFDEAITRVSFGWPSVDAYYAGSSSAARVPGIRVPYLAVQVGEGGCRERAARRFWNTGRRPAAPSLLGRRVGPSLTVLLGLSLFA